MGRRQGIYSHHGCQNAERWRNEKRGDEKISSFRTPGGDQATKPPFFLRSTVTCRLCLGPPSYLKGGKFTTPDSDQRRLLLHQRSASLLHHRCLAGDLRRQPLRAWY